MIKGEPQVNHNNQPVYMDAHDFTLVQRSRIIANVDKILYIGEVHEQEWLIEEVAALLGELCMNKKLSFLAVEYFNVEQQDIIDKWLRHEITFEELNSLYKQGPEGFNLAKYKPILDEARRCGTRIIGVMPPRTLARQVSRTLNIPTEYRDILDPLNVIPEYEEMITSLFPREGPMARIPVKNLLVAQSFKDSVAAAKVAEAIRLGPGAVIMGWAHVEVKGAVATRVAKLTGLNKHEYTVLGAGEGPSKVEFTKKNRGLLETDYLLIK